MAVQFFVLKMCNIEPEIMIDEDTKWKMRILHQIHTDDPVSIGRKSCLYTMLEYCALARLSAHTD